MYIYIYMYAGNRGSVVESDFCTKLKFLMYTKERNTNSLRFMVSVIFDKFVQLLSCSVMTVT